jgi:uncharacterized RmlC-like cupin family protein
VRARHLCAIRSRTETSFADCETPTRELLKAHKHDDHETAIYVLSGESGCWYGDKLQHHLIAHAGDFLYIPANMPHLPYNLSDTESCVAVIARTDPNEQESVVLLPELENCSDWLARDTPPIGVG